MKVLFSIFQFYINASIHVAIAVTALVWISVVELELKVPNALWYFIFFGTVSGYNFVKYAKVAGLHHRSLAQSLKTIQIFSALCLMGLFFTVFYLKIETLLATAGFGLLTFFYAVPVKRKKNLRTFSSLKIFVVALVWAGVTVIVPLVEDGRMLFTVVAVLTFIQRSLLVLVLIIPFEIRDLRYDTIKLQTLPQRYGVTNAKRVGIVFLVIIVLLEFLKNAIPYQHLYALGIVVFLCLLALGLAKKKQTEYFASFWVESIPIVWVLGVLLFRHFLP